MKTHANVVCPACGCLCDDIELTIERNRIVTARRACVLGKRWFFSDRSEHGPVCLVDGAPAPLDNRLGRAAEVLAAAEAPLVFGLTDQTCETQRAAVALADWIGAVIDMGEPASTAEIEALQTVGKVSASLGEVANRSDLVLFWRTDPAQTHPRHLVRYSLLPKGLFTPGGKKDRTCIVLDTHQTKTAQAADLMLQIHPDRELETLAVLRAILSGITVVADRVQTETGVPLAQWQALIERMKAARYGAIFYEPNSTNANDNPAAETARLTALFSLTRELNAHARFVALANSGAGNARGAKNVLAWRTGYPGAVDFSQGYPRYRLREHSAEEILAHRAADAALVVGDRATEGLSDAAREHLQSIPRIALADRPCEATADAAVAFHIATDGIHTSGTMFRMDDVALPVRPVLSTSRPSAQSILEQLETHLRSTRLAASPPSPAGREPE